MLFLPFVQAFFQKFFWKFKMQEFTFAPVLSKQLIKKGRGTWPVEALATLPDFSPGRRCQVHPEQLAMASSSARDKSEIKFDVKSY
jgi:hypothetical protein